MIPVGPGARRHPDQVIELDTDLIDGFCLESEKSYERMQLSRGK